MHPAFRPGTLLQIGDLSMVPDSTLNIRFGEVGSSEVDQLGGATLNLSAPAGYTVQTGDTYISLDTALLFFADNSGEDNRLEVTSLRIYNTSLTAAEIAVMGSASDLDTDGDGVSDDNDADDDRNLTRTTIGSTSKPTRLSWIYIEPIAPVNLPFPQPSELEHWR